jgi:hypothetical protein
MTLAGIKSTRKEVEEIRAMFPRPPELSPEQQAWMDSLSDVEIIALAGRIMGIKTDPRILLQKEPETPRDCGHCGFALTGDAAQLRHVPCDFLERGGFRP